MSVTATGFITDDELADLVRQSLRKVDADALPDEVWLTSLQFWNVGTYQQIVNHWVSKGYSLADVQNWNAGKLYQQNLALYSVLIKQNVDDSQIASWEKELDYWRRQLDEQEKLVSGGVLAEAASTVELYEIHTRGY